MEKTHVCVEKGDWPLTGEHAGPRVGDEVTVIAASTDSQGAWYTLYEYSDYMEYKACRFRSLTDPRNSLSKKLAKEGLQRLDQPEYIPAPKPIKVTPFEQEEILNEWPAQD